MSTTSTRRRPPSRHCGALWPSARCPWTSACRRFSIMSSLSMGGSKFLNMSHITSQWASSHDLRATEAISTYSLWRTISRTTLKVPTKISRYGRRLHFSPKQRKKVIISCWQIRLEKRLRKRKVSSRAQMKRISNRMTRILFNLTIPTWTKMVNKKLR